MPKNIGFSSKIYELDDANVDKIASESSEIDELEVDTPDFEENSSRFERLARLVIHRHLERSVKQLESKLSKPELLESWLSEFPKRHSEMLQTDLGIDEQLESYFSDLGSELADKGGESAEYLRSQIDHVADYVVGKVLSHG